mmetsp:Transcript_27452/g.44174  ORF Transcript_27452/g.44174 Transcript_27452/m.44174 type:complete len:226 (+) Transcript_27452:62-739(+)
MATSRSAQGRSESRPRFFLRTVLLAAACTHGCGDEVFGDLDGQKGRRVFASTWEEGVVGDRNVAASPPAVPADLGNVPSRNARTQSVFAQHHSQGRGVRRRRSRSSRDKAAGHRRQCEGNSAGIPPPPQPLEPVDCSKCAARYYVATACTASQSRTCATCTVCTSTQYEKTPCGTVSDTRCQSSSAAPSPPASTTPYSATASSSSSSPTTSPAICALMLLLCVVH